MRKTIEQFVEFDKKMYNIIEEIIKEDASAINNIFHNFHPKHTEPLMDTICTFVYGENYDEEIILAGKDVFVDESSLEFLLWFEIEEYVENRRQKNV